MVRLIVLKSVLLLLLLIWGCKRPEVYLMNGTLVFSSDSVKFDTLFTTVKSPTGRLYIYNASGQPIRISEIKVDGGANSPFKLTFEGYKGQSYKNYDMLKADSATVFVDFQTEVKYDADFTDKLTFRIGDKTQSVTLFARVLDAYFYRTDTICNTTLPTDKPIVIDGPLIVPEGCALTIPAGAKLYFTSRRDARSFNFFSQIAVFGSLFVNGTSTDPVLFTNFRLNKTWQDIAGQWQGIRFFKNASYSSIQNAIVQNGSIGIQVDSISLAPSLPKLYLENVIVRNMANYCLLGLGFSAGSEGTYPAIEAHNCLMYNAGQQVLGLFGGGVQSFTNCTVAGVVSSAIRPEPTAALTNYLKLSESKVLVYPADFRFKNCIIWGREEEAFAVDLLTVGNPKLSLSHCLVKTKNNVTTALPTNIFNQDPRFENPSSKKYTLKPGSPAIDAGTNEGILPYDLNNQSRDNKPDIGAFEFKKP